MNFDNYLTIQQISQKYDFHRTTVRKIIKNCNDEIHFKRIGDTQTSPIYIHDDSFKEYIRKNDIKGRSATKTSGISTVWVLYVISNSGHRKEVAAFTSHLSATRAEAAYKELWYRGICFSVNTEIADFRVATPEEISHIPNTYLEDDELRDKWFFEVEDNSDEVNY